MKTTPLLLCCLFLGAASCHSGSSTNTTISGADSVATDSLAAPDVPDPFYIKNYEGNMGGNLPIKMVLINWGDGYLSGRYWYEGKKGILQLSGELEDDNTFEIFESHQGKETGLFSGVLADPLLLVGTWHNQAKTKSLPFELHALAPDTLKSKWDGNWFLNDIWDSGTLMIGNVTRDSFDFALFFMRSGHTGMLEGQASLQGDKAYYRQADFAEEPCALEFVHQGSYLEIKQSSSNFACGFGARAYASGNFERKRHKETATLKVGTGSEAVFPAQGIHDAFKELVGQDMYETFAFNMHTFQRTIDKTGKTTVTGYAPGFFGSNEAIIIFDQQGRIWAATLDYDSVTTEVCVRYFTNDPSSRRNMPADIETWREGFKDLRVVL